MDPGLPGLVARVFATDLLCKSLKDLQPQISSSIVSLLSQLKSEEALVQIQSLNVVDINAAPVYSRKNYRKNFNQSRPAASSFRPTQNKPPPSKPTSTSQRGQSNKMCSFCQGWNRPCWGHTIGSCKYLSEAEKSDIAKRVTKSFRVDTDLQAEVEDRYDEYDDEDQSEQE